VTFDQLAAWQVLHSLKPLALCLQLPPHPLSVVCCAVDLPWSCLQLLLLLMAASRR
jgi:hypothetical protein